MGAIKINGVNHFAISVADFDASIAWYERIFGFTIIDKGEIPGINVKVCHMQGVGFQLEIFCAANAKPLPEDRKVPNLDLLTHGNKHISFGVVDAHQAKNDMIAMGVEIAFVAEVNGTYGVFIRDNTGNLIEIFEEGTPKA
jgi:methylmalonyl-CoA/ethylmalonyl-CoA epimerase